MKRRRNARGWYFALGIAALMCAILCCAAERRAAAADTNDSSREPILRIETGMHIAGIIAIATDAENNY
ncbi:MAG TPA: hypothetical protein VIH76_18710, partial [Candidatus Acidoferrales bacterium]